VRGARHPQASHLVFLFATLLTLASGVMFSVADVDVDVGAFAFQVAGMDMVVVMFVGVSVTGSVAYDVAGMRREGDEAKDLPNVMYPLPLCQPFFASAARASHWTHLAFDAVIMLNEGGCWACVMTFTTTRLVGWDM